MSSSKGKVPRFKEGYLFKRSHFLDKTLHTFFGPEQPPTAVTGNVFGYQAPKRWPAAGSLLRVPQVVWLGAYFGYPMNMTQTVLANLVPYRTSYPNHFWEELTRLLGVFDDVKAAIEELRPNRTFVTNVHWHTDDLLDYAIRPLNSNMSLLQVQSPAAEAEFFGTDFLHVCCGDLGVNVNSSYQASVGAYFYDGASTQGNPDVWMEGEAFAAAKDAIEGCVDKFAGYAAWLYPQQVSWSDWLDKPDPFHVIAPLVAGLNAHTPSNILIQQKIADALEGSGFKFGGTSNQVDEGYLIARIADHFRFDPDNGKDL